LKIAALDFTRLALRIGVDKHGAAALAERLGKFRGELVAGDNLGVLASELLTKQMAGVPAEPVITPQGISVANNQSPRSGVQCPGIGIRKSKVESRRDCGRFARSQFRVSSFEFRISLWGLGLSHRLFNSSSNDPSGPSN
jgi:hypothetical protein